MLAFTKKYNIHWITFLLAWIAGYCDTVTFVAGDSIFSAHVTGNFIVFAAQVISGRDEGSWIKLVTFPVFVAAVMTGGWLAGKVRNRYRILLAESILLIAGALCLFLFPQSQLTGTSLYFVVMLTVFAMGLQNTFGRLFAKETHGPTTMMTGNVTQASLDLGNILRKGIGKDALSWQSLRKQFVTIGGFLAGCLLGAWFGKLWGLVAIGIPGVALFFSYYTAPTVEIKKN